MLFTTQPISKTLAILLSLGVLTACSSSDDDIMLPGADDSDMPSDGDPPIVGGGGPQSFAFVSTRAPDFSSGQIERLSLTDGNTLDATYPGTGSDIRVDTEGSYVYQIGRFQIDSITRFSPTDTSTADYQISVNGDDTQTANPYDLTFVDDDKAYLTRRSGTDIWVVDPTPDNTPATVEDFLISKIDLSAYATGTADDIDPPDMTDAIIVDDKLFVLMENLTAMGFNQIADSRAYLAVFDIQTDQEINTMKSGSDLNAIQLLTVNPSALQYNPTTGLIYVVGRGNFSENELAPGDPYTGGIEIIDPFTFDHSLLVDDGDNDNNQGFFIDAVIIDETLGYLITLDGFDASFNSIANLRSFNPSTGELSAPLDGTAGQDLASLDVGPDGHLWVGINDTQPGFIRVDLASGDVVADRVNTQLIPSSIVFITTEP